MKNLFNQKYFPVRSAAVVVMFLTIALSLAGCGKGKKIPGLDRFNVSVIKGQLYASFVATSLHWDQGLTVPIPGLDDATLTFGPDLASSGTVFQFAIPLVTLATTGRNLPLSGLPDGRAIPEIDGGALPRWDAHIGSISLSLFLNNDVFGLFVPINLTTPGGYTLPSTVSMLIKDERGNRVGKVFAIPTANGAGQSGLLVLLPIVKGKSTSTTSASTNSTTSPALVP